MIRAWIVRYHHRHGEDCWLEYSENEPDLEKIADNLDDFEPHREEYLESFSTDLVFANEDELANHRKDQ